MIHRTKVPSLAVDSNCRVSLAFDLEVRPARRLRRDDSATENATAHFRMDVYLPSRYAAVADDSVSKKDASISRKDTPLRCGDAVEGW